jgi:hypothetical protein
VVAAVQPPGRRGGAVVSPAGRGWMAGGPETGGRGVRTRWRGLWPVEVEEERVEEEEGV